MNWSSLAALEVAIIQTDADLLSIGPIIWTDADWLSSGPLQAKL